MEDYLASEELSEFKREYVDGEIYPMATSTLDHSRISGTLTAALYQRLRGKPCEVFGTGARVKIDQGHRTRLYYPDSQVICQPVDGRAYFVECPTLVAEVMWESTRRIDTVEKTEAYLSIPSLKVLLLVDSEVKWVTVYRRSASGGFERESYDDSGVIPLVEIGTELPLEEIYEDMEFR